jgi:hypothetical protein
MKVYQYELISEAGKPFYIIAEVPDTCNPLLNAERMASHLMPSETAAKCTLKHGGQIKGLPQEVEKRPFEEMPVEGGIVRLWLLDEPPSAD